MQSVSEVLASPSFTLGVMAGKRLSTYRGSRKREVMCGAREGVTNMLHLKCSAGSKLFVSVYFSLCGRK